MAEEYHPDHHQHHEHEHKSYGECEEPKVVTASEESVGVESTDRGLFGFMGKKEEEKEQPYKQDEVLVTEFDNKVQVSEYELPKEECKEEKKEGLLAKLHRSGSSSSSSSDEEEGEYGEKKKKKKKEKKGLKEKIEEKISGDHKKEEEKKYEHHEHEHKHERHDHDTNVPIEKEEVVYTETVVQPEEKKGFIEKIKEKLPGQGKKPEEVPLSPPSVEYTPPPAEQHCHDGEGKEKKGFLDKIKEKLPGYHHKTEEEKEKEKEKECASH